MSGNTLVLDPVVPLPLIVITAVTLLLLSVRVYQRVGASIGPWRWGTLLVFRVAGLALVLLLLLRPSRQEFLPPPTTERVVAVALDTSLSMKQRDVQGATRFDAARNLLIDAKAVASSGVPDQGRVRVFGFSDDAVPIEQSVLELAPFGRTTRLHKSVTTLLNAPSAGEALNAVILLTDGHDFEMVNPVKTGTAARSRRVPIYAIALGEQGRVRDVSARITSFQPYCYVKQNARISAALRLVGCELEDLTVQLLRHGTLVQTKRVNAGEFQELPVEFEIAEPEPGQYEYEVRVQPLQHETDPANNSAITYVNVIDQQIRALVLEGDPYWDTTFLQRSLMRNDKFDVDALLRYGKDRVRAIRKNPDAGEFRVPATLDQLAVYDLIVLGRSVEQILGEDGLELVNQFARDRAGTVIFSRGRAFGTAASELEPVLWAEATRERVRLDVAAEGRALSAFRTLDSVGGMDALPELLAGRDAVDIQPLTATLATAASGDAAGSAPAVVHRRYGRGQVVSVGVEGLWRWGLNAKVEGINSPFDRFWDQMILWLLAGRDFIPNRQFSFRPHSANILLGEKIHFKLTMRQPDPAVKTIPVTVYFGDVLAGRVNMAASAVDSSRLVAEYLPERIGRYRAVSEFPDGSTQESRFIVFTENLEETEVTTDALCLRRLCESSGGRLLEPGDLSRLLEELSSDRADLTPETRLEPVWNRAWVFYLAGLLFGLDWFLRRRWGLC